MAAKGQNLPTLMDVASRTDPDGGIASIAEILSQVNEILQDAPYLEANKPSGHMETVRTGLPQSYWLRFNKGIMPSKSRTQQVTDTIGRLGALSQIDKDLLEFNGNSAQWRLSEDKGHIEGMSQTLAETIFYGNELTNPDQFTGLSARYSSLSAENGTNIIDAGGSTGKLVSMWLICWDTDTINMRYPKGMSSTAGINVKDEGEQRVTMSDGSRLTMVETTYKTNGGLSVKDWRYAVRIANIPEAALTEDGSNVDLWNLIIKAVHKLPMMNKGRCYFYMNRAVRTWFDIQSFNKKNVQLDRIQLDGQELTGFRGIPFRTCDALDTNEQRVV